MIKTFAVALAAGSALGATFPEPKLPASWVDSQSFGAAADMAQMKVTISLPSRNMKKLKGVVADVSTPGRASYGKHWSKDEVNAMTSADPADVAAVMEWLARHGISASVHPSGSSIVLQESQAKIEEVFNTRVRKIQNTVTGQSTVRADDYTIPSPVQESVLGVFGLHGLPLPPRSLEKVNVKDNKFPVNVNPAALLKKYKVSGVQVSRGTKNRQAVAEFQGQNAEQSDLTRFFKEQVNSTAYQKGDELIYKVVGSNGAESGEEAALDIQYIMGAAPGIKTEFWGFQGNDFCADMLDFTNKILETENPPNVFSISYGWQGELSAIGCSDTSAVDNNLVKIAARGVSVLVSSGDSGSSYKKPFFKKGKLYPSWPASSPYVTAVGATRFINQNVNDGEEATDQFGSGGGFSYDFDRTDAQYQEAAVDKYLSIVADKPPSDLFLASGRGTPDVSAIGEGYIIYSDNNKVVIGGTSASCPLFAALVSLLNEARIAKGLSPLGLLNPLLYQNPGAFNDVVRGTGAVTRSGTTAKYGWDAAPGWDAVTGLGTPQFDKLLAAALRQ